jgi:hypothetical protein
MAQPNLVEEQNDFSLVLGGPIFQLFRKTHLEGHHLELLRRRIVVITLFVWLPLLLLSALASPAGGAGLLSFLRDVEVQARFLVALPILISAELLVHLRMRPVVRRFVERRIVLPEDKSRFESAIQSAIRSRNSIPVSASSLRMRLQFGASGRRMEWTRDDTSGTVRSAFIKNANRSKPNLQLCDRRVLNGLLLDGLNDAFLSERATMPGWVEKRKKRDSNPNDENEISDKIQHRRYHHFLDGDT